MKTEAAVEALIGRVAVIESVVGERFPLSADPATGRWTTTVRGSWTGGFWVGLLWLRAALTDARADRDAAAGWAARLLPRAADDTDTRAMTFWYGAGIGHRLTGSERARAVAMTGATAVADAFDAGRGLVPVGSALYRSGEVPLASPDSLAAIVGLMASADGVVSGASSLAATHARTVIGLCVADDGAGQAVARPACLEPTRRPITRARGQAWTMLGCAVAAERLGEPFHEPAVRTATWWLRQVRGSHPTPAMIGTDECPPDSSAAAIAAAALMTVAGLPHLDRREAAEFRAAAASLIYLLSDVHLDASGVLRDGCYDLAAGVAVADELIWGTYFAMAVLSVHCGRVGSLPW